MHEQHMRRALELAIENVRLGRGGPFGAVIAGPEGIIAEGSNIVTSTNDPTAHAEIVAIRRACEKRGHFELRGLSLYTSCEPCPMCLGAVYWARLDALYYSGNRDQAAAAGFDDSMIYEEVSRPVTQRRIPVLRLLAEEGAKPFIEWMNSANKIPY